MKILIVDDHSYNRQLLSFVLEDEGHQCVEAENGKIACEMCSDDPEIKIVLMDVNMPIMDGITATKIIKNNANDSYITIIFVTALDNADILVKCLDAGGDDFVPKPINESILLSKLKAHSRNQALYDNVKLMHDELAYHKSLVDREHRIVEHIFSNDVNLAETECDNVKSYTSPASLFNGDLLLTAPSPAGGLYVLIGDFTGHGLSAAVGSLAVSGIFYDYASRQESIGNMAKTINKRLARLLPPGMFFCACLIYMEPNGRRIQVWMGGMNDLLCVALDSVEIKKYVSKHMPLGILEDEEFDVNLELIELNAGSKIYIFTDGVNEARNCNDEEFGLERIEQLVLSQDGNVINSIVSAVRDFTQGCDQADDVSVLELISQPVIHRNCKDNQIADVGQAYRNAESIPWQLKMALEVKDLQSSDVVNQIVKFLGAIHGVELHQDKIFTIISELYSNALEHGVLDLNSEMKSNPDGFDEYYRLRSERLGSLTTASIGIEMEYLRGNSSTSSINKLRIIVTDSGKGFNYQALNLSQDENEEAHGRGLSLLQTFCESLIYSNGGKTVTAIYAFS